VDVYKLDILSTFRKFLSTSAEEFFGMNVMDFSHRLQTHTHTHIYIYKWQVWVLLLEQNW